MSLEAMGELLRIIRKSGQLLTHKGDLPKFLQEEWHCVEMLSKQLNQIELNTVKNCTFRIGFDHGLHEKAIPVLYPTYPYEEI